MLEKSPQGESSLRYRLYSPDHGLVTLMKRASAKKTSMLPDVFDEISAVCRAGSRNVWFVSEFERLSSRISLAADYERFSAAAEISKIVAANSTYLENHNTLYAHTLSAIDSLASGGLAHIVEFKFLYLFARSEGYPVKESFLAGLNAEDLERTVEILKGPSDSVSSEPEAQRLLRVLKHWISAFTDLTV